MDKLSIVLIFQGLVLLLLVIVYRNTRVEDSPDRLVAKEKAKLELEKAKAEKEERLRQEAIRKEEEHKLYQEARELEKGF